MASMTWLIVLSVFAAWGVLSITISLIVGRGLSIAEFRDSRRYEHTPEEFRRAA